MRTRENSDEGIWELSSQEGAYRYTNAVLGGSQTWKWYVLECWKTRVEDHVERGLVTSRVLVINC